VVFAQFAAYHVDRCEAAAARLADRFEVLAVEVASASQTYAWQPSGEVKGATKVTLFPGAVSERIGWFRKLRAMLGVLRQCQWVFVGVPSSAAEVIVLTWLLPLLGTKVVMLTESKYDDLTRRTAFEFFKAQLYRPYCGAIVGGRRHAEYMRLLGFDGRRVLPGYDTVDLDRVLRQSGSPPAPQGRPFAERGFLYVGRFVEKKNLLTLVDAFARYRELAGEHGRDLVLAGAGPMQDLVEERIRRHGIAASVSFPGFLDAAQVAQAMADSLALLLPSTEEQWGLVVNEAVACGLPAIVSEAVGARDALVRAGENGFVCRADDIEGLARAMLETAADEARWRAMCERSLELGWMGHTDRFADAVETMIEGDASPSLDTVRRFEQALGIGKE